MPKAIPGNPTPLRNRNVRFTSIVLKNPLSRRQHFEFWGVVSAANAGRSSALLVLLVLLSSRELCDFAQANDSSQSWPTKEWQTSTPEEQGMDSAALAQLVNFVGIYKQDSLLIIRHGKIVVDAYYAPYAPNIRHDLRSVTKSFIGTLTGIEVQEGLLDSVDHPIVDLFADEHISIVDDAKKAITVQNMLDMTSGIAWSEDAYTPDETIVRMYKAPDITEFVLSQPMSDPPGARFYYNGGNPYVLSALITKKTGRDALDFARDELFKPLGISSVVGARPTPRASRTEKADYTSLRTTWRNLAISTSAKALGTAGRSYRPRGSTARDRGR